MSKHLSVCLLLIACAFLNAVLGHQDKMCTLDDRKRHIGFCGRNFADFISTLCGKGGYNKRSQQMPNDAGLEDPLNDDDGGMQYFLPKSAALSYIHNDLKRTSKFINNMNVFTGPMCECCHHQCSIMEMAQYCKEPQKAIQGLGISFAKK